MVSIAHNKGGVLHYIYDYKCAAFIDTITHTLIKADAFIFKKDEARQFLLKLPSSYQIC